MASQFKICFAFVLNMVGVTINMNMKNVTLGFIGFVLILLPLIGGNVKYLADWGSAELVGYNFFTVLCFVVGALLLKKYFKKDLTTKENSQN